MSKITPNDNGVCAAQGFYTDGIAIGLKAKKQERYRFYLFGYAV
jgi:hypothetical protein